MSWLWIVLGALLLAALALGYVSFRFACVRRRQRDLTTRESLEASHYAPLADEMLAGMVNSEQVVGILHAIGDKIIEQKLYLSELDNVIGDGDHGINLARGFLAVQQKEPAMQGKDVGTIFKTVGMRPSA